MATLDRVLRPRLEAYIQSELHIQNASQTAPQNDIIIECDRPRWLAEMGLQTRYMLPFMGVCCATASISQLQQLANAGWVKHCSADMQVQVQTHTAAEVMGVPRLWQLSTGSTVTVAVIDTGIQPNVEFLWPHRIAAFVDLVNGRRDPYDDQGHGTFVASVLAGSGLLSRGYYKGMAPNCELAVIKAMNSEGGGRTSDVLAGLQWVADQRRALGIEVATLSIGSPVVMPPDQDPLVKGVEALWALGVTVVVAAGNDGPALNTITTPGVSPRVITVGAMEDGRNDIVGVAAFSGRGGEGCDKPDLLAPGVDIVGLRARPEEDGWFTTMSGTSMATPLVAGVVALLREQHPHWSPDQVKEYLISHSRVLEDVPPEAQGNGALYIPYKADSIARRGA